MIYIERTHTDPFFNIATEEYLLKNLQDEILMFWQSTDSVILGKHQNTLKEVNLEYVNLHEIPVIRRISGGGTVFHDLGNINYTLITRGEKQENLVDFKKFTLPVIRFLEQFGLKTQFEGKNNLTLDGKKFSGNSAHVFKNRVMHHGTFLFETKLNVLEQIINPDWMGIQDKSIGSIKASVTNISSHLSENITLESFKQRMEDFFTDYFEISSRQNLTHAMIADIQKLADEKYHLWSWNYGYSPKYSFKNEVQTATGTFQVEMKVKDGHIQEIELLRDGKRLTPIENQILGSAHDKTVLLEKISQEENAGIPVEVLFPGTSPNKVRNNKETS